jgi:hypothetical protein
MSDFADLLIVQPSHHDSSPIAAPPRERFLMIAIAKELKGLHNSLRPTSIHV